MAAVNIMTWAWSGYSVISRLPKSTADSLSVFKNAEVKNHITEKGEIPVLEFREITTAAMSIFVSFLKKEDVSKKLDDWYYYPAFPDLLVFMTKQITNDEFFTFSMQELYDPLIAKMFESLTNPDDATNVEETKAALVKCEVPVPEKYKSYF